MLRILLPLVFCTSFAFAQELPPGAFARLGGTALRHPEKPIALAFRPGTVELASLGSDGTVKIWDTTTGKELHTLRKKDSQANAMAMSANGKFLAVHFDENLLRIYDATKKYEQAFSLSVKMFEGMTITDDGTLVAGLQAGRPVIIETANGLDRMELFGGTAIAIAPDGKSAALAQKDRDEHTVGVFEVPSGKRMLIIVRPGNHKANISSIAYAPDSRTLAMASDEGAPIVVFQLGKEKPLATFDGAGPVSFANEKSLYGRINGKLAIWTMDGKVSHELFSRPDVGAYAVTHDVKLAATESGGVLGSPRIRFWNISDWREIREMTFGVEAFTGLNEVRTHSQGGVGVFSETGLSHWNPTLEGDAATSIPHPRLQRAHTPTSPDANRIAVEFVNRKTPLIVIHSGSFERMDDLPLVSPALGVAVHPEGKSFAAITRDGFVRVWNPEGKELWVARTTRSLRAGIAYSPDGKTLAVTSIIRVALFDSAEGNLLGSIARQWEEGPFTSVCFNNDGSLLAAGTMGPAGSGVVYEFASRKPVKRCEGNAGSVIGVAFAAKSDVLVTAHSDDSLWAWRLVPEAKAEVPLAKHWEAMLSNEPAVAWPAMMALVDSKAKGVETVAEGIKALPDDPVKKDAFELRKQRAGVVLNRIGSDEAKALLKSIQ